MSTKLFPEIRKRLSEATPGPWYIEEDKEAGTYCIVESGKKYLMEFSLSERDAKLASNAPTDIAVLLEALDIAEKAMRDAIKVEFMWRRSSDVLDKALSEIKALSDRK